MSNMVTRCPKCATSFRITSAQLQSAKGAVRCGSCLHIFKAQDHLLSGEAPVAAPPLVRKTVADQDRNAPPAQPAAAPAVKMSESSSVKDASSAAAHADPTPTPSATKTSSSAPIVSGIPAQPSTDKLLFDQTEIDDEIAAFGDDDDVLISDDMDQKTKDSDAFDFDEFLQIDAQPRQPTSLFERKTREVIRDDQDDADESWAENLLDEDDEAERNQIAGRTAASENGNHADRTIDEGEEEFNYSAPAPSNYDTAVKGPVFSLIDDNPDAENNYREIFTEKELSEEIRAVNRDEIPSHTGAPDVPMRAYDTSRAALLMNIMPEPVVMTSRRKRSWYQRKFWTLLSLLMMVLLVMQLAWMQFDNLSRIYPYRSVYELICPTLGCTVPTLVDRSKIRVRNLLVRKHPDIANALMVDVIILNNAAFEQPFPDLVMAFSNIDDQLLAARRFIPREYLAGELAGIKLMPQNQPVHVSLELVDPGEEAVNYKIEPY